MCKCCFYSGGTTNGNAGSGAPGSGSSQPAMRQYTLEFEPVTTQPFTDAWEKKLTSVHQVKGTWAYFVNNFEFDVNVVPNDITNEI